MKRIFAILLAAIMLVGILSLTGCGKNDTPAPSDSTSPAPSDSAEPSDDSQTPDDGEEYKLVVSAHSPGTSTQTYCLNLYLEHLTEVSNGRLQFEVYTDGALSNAAGAIDGINSGMFDMCLINTTQLSGMMSLWDFIALPGLFSNGYEANTAFFDLYQDCEELHQVAESNGIRIIGGNFSEGCVFFSTKEIHSLDDMAGMRIATTSAQVTSILNEIGAIPVGMTSNEVYEALSKNSIEATATANAQSAAGFGIQEVAPYIYNLNLGAAPMFYAIGVDTYNKLPADLQQIIDESYVWQIENAYKNYNLELQLEKTSMEKCLEAGCTVIEPEEADVNRLKELASKLAWEEWIKQEEGKGNSTARDILEEYIATYAEYAGTCPDFT